MKTSKKWTLLVSVFVCLALLSASTAWAGGRGGYHGRHHGYRYHHGKHFWPGVAIGVGAAMVGAAILQSTTPPTTYVYQSPVPPAGHYEYRQVWVPPQYQNTWVAGQYTRHGQWVAGHWESQQVRPGHYAQQRVWVTY